MSLILRQIKGEKLTIPEMDGNLTYLESLEFAPKKCKLSLCKMISPSKQN